MLIIGCCIGAGMLGLPVLTATAGLLPTAVAMLLCATFMATTSLLLLEAALWFGSEASLISMARETLGKGGSAVTWLLFLFLFYCLGIAYAGGSGELLGNGISVIWDLPEPHLIGSVLSSLLVGLLVYMGTRPVDYLNRLLMALLILSYLSLIGVGAFHVRGDQLMHHRWPAVLSTVPILLISFGFHNMIPSLTHYVRYDVSKMRFAIIGGTLGAFFIYLFWEIIILGILPPAEHLSLETILDKGEMVTHQLRWAIGSAWVLPMAHIFAFAAIATSSLANSLSFVDFLADGFHIHAHGWRRLLLCLLVLVPPLIIAIAMPNLFLKALHLAGATATVILFGIMPALIVWFGRRQRPGQRIIVAGGNATLSFIILIALGILVLEVHRNMA